MINTIIFDMDGVLFDTEKIGNICWVEAAERMGLGDLSEGNIGCIGLNRNDSVALMHRLYGEAFPMDDFWKTVSDLMKEKIINEGLPIKKGVMELLTFLKEKKFKIGLASSSAKQNVMRNLEQSKLGHYFDYIVGGDMVEHSKPEPDIYLKACEGMQTVPEEAFAVEDSPNGIRAAYRAGMKVMMVPDLIAPDDELKEMLYGLFPSLIEVKEALIKQNQ